MDLNELKLTPNLCSCSVSWRWASNARNMSRLWTLIKWKWSVYQVGCVYYVIMSGTVKWHICLKEETFCCSLTVNIDRSVVWLHLSGPMCVVFGAVWTCWCSAVARSRGSRMWPHLRVSFTLQMADTVYRAAVEHLSHTTWLKPSKVELCIL
jgi:hypothetical protein